MEKVKKRSLVQEVRDLTPTSVSPMNRLVCVGWEDTIKHFNYGFQVLNSYVSQWGFRKFGFLQGETIHGKPKGFGD